MKINPKIIIHPTIIFLIITIDCIIIKNNLAFEIIVYLLTIILISLCVINWKAVYDQLNKSSLEQYILLISLEIALIVFIQTSIQIQKNNEQFEQNKDLLNRLSESAEKQLELSRQTIDDYLFETKANLDVLLTKISNRDTLNNGNIKLTIVNIIHNNGRREAKDVEFRQAIIFDTATTSMIAINKESQFFVGNKRIETSFATIMALKYSTNFNYWLQIRYRDEKINRQIDRSYYFHYFKTSKGFEFYHARSDEKKAMRKVIDKSLARNKLSLTTN